MGKYKECALTMSIYNIKMRTALNNKIIVQIKFLQKICFELHITEYSYFLNKYSSKITTSGDKDFFFKD